MSITHTVYRDDDQTVITVEATGYFYKGLLDGWQYTSSKTIALTKNECDTIVQKLVDDHADDWNENGWKGDRCHHD